MLGATSSSDMYDKYAVRMLLFKKYDIIGCSFIVQMDTTMENIPAYSNVKSPRIMYFLNITNINNENIPSKNIINDEHKTSEDSFKPYNTMLVFEPIIKFGMSSYDIPYGE